jgi:arsenical pump membrane protein
VPFAFAVFTAAGVAPLVISNPMNLVVADHAGIGFNQYAVTMVPVAAVGWLVAYLVLARVFREPLADDAPALGAWPGPPPRLGGGGRVVVVILLGALVAYPITSYLGGPLWLVAAVAAAACLVAALASGVAPRDLAAGVTWSVFPFLAGVFVLALGLEHVGVVDRLAALYDGPAPLATIGGAAALGSAALNNHPMAILNLLALDRAGAAPAHVLAALVGGDLGPRLLPMGSLAGLLWIEALRRHGVVVPVPTFARVGALVTAPTLAVSLGLLWLLQ